MKAARLHSPGNIRVDDIPRPSADAGDIIIRVRAASICGTDRRIAANGHFKLPEGTPRVLGHEFAGEIVEAGSEVSGYAVGDRVSVTPNVGCGTCPNCLVGLNNMCPSYEAFGITMDGGFQEYVRIPRFALNRGNVFHLPETVGYAEAALVEPLSCCYNAVSKLDVRPDSTVLIMGAGPIGACHVMLAKLYGARKVIVSNNRQPRLDFAGTLGADVLVNLTERDLATVVAEETGGLGVDVALTCVSKPEVQAQAVDLLATHGRVNFFAGLGKAQPVALDTNRVHYQGLTLTGTTGSSNSDYASALSLVGEGRLDLSPLISQTFTLDDIEKAMDYAGSGQGMKAMILFESN
ncbi:Alcohol dehydrogenase GroES domain protein [Arthrobacter sp. FB24]|jgi:threonine dehydrogenase-like Zn-dependent dehydrogenase|uniref:zinc-dependent dehydrogenase n=1 Tax=Arthrobacter sp. (strain FB24) TaxID=290399 RepID=UPI0000E5D5E7|nr:zinc-dependent dehydrogenase [Arthrobacter sp. FB24]ABK03194.1 Alcohol dehydrogenase GroES domain protein [Arthrobacter sp. FB24]